MKQTQRLALPLLTSCCLLAHAEVTEKLSFLSYQVRVLPGQSLLQALNRTSPIRKGGEIFHGFTHWQVKWRFNWQTGQDGRCRVTQVNTDVVTEITLPEALEMPPDAATRFASFLKALRAHELGHRQVGLEAAQAIDQALLNMPAQDNCRILEHSANQLGHQIIARHQAKDVDYDSRTGHGKTQGASLLGR